MPLIEWHSILCLLDLVIGDGHPREDVPSVDLHYPVDLLLAWVTGAAISRDRRVAMLSEIDQTVCDRMLSRFEQKFYSSANDSTVVCLSYWSRFNEECRMLSKEWITVKDSSLLVEIDWERLSLLAERNPSMLWCSGRDLPHQSGYTVGRDRRHTSCCSRSTRSK